MLRIMSTLFMEVDEVHDGNPLVKKVRMSQISVMLGCITELSNFNKEQVIESFNSIFKECVSDFSREKRVSDGDDLLNKILNNEKED